MHRTRWRKLSDRLDQAIMIASDIFGRIKVDGRLEHTAREAPDLFLPRIKPNLQKEKKAISFSGVTIGMNCTIDNKGRQYEESRNIQS